MIVHKDVESVKLVFRDEGRGQTRIYLPFRFPSPLGVYAYLGDDFQAGLGSALFAYCLLYGNNSSGETWAPKALLASGNGPTLCLAVHMSGIVV